jgi:zinc/manganese transport system substrate-binding protein/manganese/iron transport system substrate-binding protein
VAPRRLLAAAALLLLGALSIAGCGNSAGANGRVKVVATTTQAADFARNVGGGRVDVMQILAANADPHEYEVRPGDVRALSGAQLVVRSGGDLDAWMDDAIQSSGTKAPVLTLIDHVHQEHRDGELDPHWWQDPRNAEQGVAAIRDALIRVDGSHAAAYRTAATAYMRRIAALDSAVARCMDGIPAARRKLVTTHDALGYYAQRYGIQVIGTVIPSLSTAGQPSAGDLAALVRTIRAAHVSAVFAESSVNPKVEAALAKQSGARVGAPLWADTLGPAGSNGATYLASIASNTRSLADSFTNGATTCTLPD